MKKRAFSLTIIVLIALSAPVMAENLVKSGDIVVDLTKVSQTETVAGLQGPLSKGEILVNPGFETGDLPPWYTNNWTVTKDNPYAGDYCATDEGNYWVRQDFDGIAATDVISITLWSRQPEEAIQAVDLMYDDGSYYEDIIWPSASWGFFDVTSWLDPTKTLVGIRVWGYSGGGPDPDLSFIDDVSVMTEGQQALKVDPDEVSAWFGGTFGFKLAGGPDLAGRDYALLGGASGSSPGTKLPGGMILPVNWDWFTELLLNMALKGGSGLVNDFIGTLDKDGNAKASLVLPGKCQLYDDITVVFAWCTFGPFDFVSNEVEATILGKPEPPDEYYYDDGSMENLLGYYAGGEMCWANYFVVGPGHETLTEVASIWGSTAYPNYGPGNGVGALCYIWEDTDGNSQLNDGDALVHTQNVTTDKYDQDIHVYYTLSSPVTIGTSGFFVGFCLNCAVGQYIIPMDESQNPTNGNTWFIGKIEGIVDPVNLSSNDDLQTMQSMGWDCYCPARAK